MSHDQIPEDDDDANPFVRALPARMDKAAQLRLLRRLPRWSKSERALRHVDRRHRVLRLLDYMDPLDRQLELVERFDMAIRQGYRGRDPSTLSFRHSLLESADAIAEGRDALGEKADIRVVAGTGFTAVYANGDPKAPRMPGFTLIGCPGMGKSATVERILHNYPLIVQHTGTKDAITQVPALKIECPSTGSRKSFCLEFFRLLDERLGQDGKLFARYGNRARTTDDMLNVVQHLVRLHAIGVLIIDEIQNLNASSEGIQPLVNFLVAMANKIGVGIVMIGTMTAKNIPQSAFHSARRAASVGSFVWDRLHRGAEWDRFVKSMWRFQWTDRHTPLDDELSDALYEYSQGVVDVVLKLFMLAQLRVIENAELNGTPEEITVEVLKAISEEDLVILAPMMEALRIGDLDQLDLYPDLKPFHDYFELVVTRTTGLDANEIRARLDAMDVAERARGDGATDHRAFYLHMLTSFGRSSAEAGQDLDRILAEFEADDVGAVASAIANVARLASAAPKAKGPKRRASAPLQAVEGDLRDVPSGAAGASVYSRFSTAGICVSPRKAIMG